MTRTLSSFAALLEKAPLHQEPETFVVTGTLARAPVEGKLVLVQAGGRAVTIDVKAVRTHDVVGQTFGQAVVEVEILKSMVGPEVLQQMAHGAGAGGGLSLVRDVARKCQPFVLATARQAPEASLKWNESVSQTGLSRRCY